MPTEHALQDAYRKYWRLTELIRRLQRTGELEFQILFKKTKTPKQKQNQPKTHTKKTK